MNKSAILQFIVMFLIGRFIVLQYFTSNFEKIDDFFNMFTYGFLQSLYNYFSLISHH